MFKKKLLMHLGVLLLVCGAILSANADMVALTDNQSQNLHGGACGHCKDYNRCDEVEDCNSGSFTTQATCEAHSDYDNIDGYQDWYCPNTNPKYPSCTKSDEEDCATVGGCNWYTGAGTCNADEHPADANVKAYTTCDDDNTST